MATIHEINEDWQQHGLAATWLKLQKAQAEHDALTAENAELREKLATKAELLRGCYAADHKRQKRVAELESALRLVMSCAGDIASAPDGLLEMALDDGDEETRQQANAFLVARAALKEDKTC